MSMRLTRNSQKRRGADQGQGDNCRRVEPVHPIAAVEDELQAADSDGQHYEAEIVERPLGRAGAGARNEQRHHAERQHAERQVEIERPSAN